MKYRKEPFLALLLIAGLHSPAIAEGDIEAGKNKAESCVACHGANGISQMPAVPGMIVPNLAGQYSDYLNKALQDYRSGARKNPSMTAMVAGLSDEDIRNLAAYYASLNGLQVVTRP